MTDNNSHLASSSSFPPSDWVETTLGDVIDFIIDNRGKNPEYYTEFGIPIIDNVLIKDTRKIDLSEARRFIDENLYNTFIRKYSLPWDVIITLVGNGYWNIAIFPNEKAVIIQNTIWIRANNQSTNIFLYYLLRHNKKKILDLNIWAAQPSIKVWDLMNIRFSLPPLPEQKAIASILSAFDDKIELLREENKTLEEMGQTIFQEWFGKYGVDDELPEGWRVGKLGEVVDLLNGFAYKSSDFIDNGKYRLVTIANVQDGSFIEQTKDGLDEIPQKMPDYCHLKTGDILLSLTGNVGRICHVIGENYFLNQRVAKLQAKEKQDYGFVYTMFRQKSMIGLLESISAGTAQQNLSPIKTAELEIIIPPREILNDFAKSINPMIDKMLDNKLQIQSLARSRDTLLPKLMRGEVRVNDFNNKK